MAGKKGNKNALGNKGGGRRPLSEEIIKKAREYHIKELAKDAVAKHLAAMAEEPMSYHVEIKEIALPIVLKDMTEKVDHTTLGQKITNSSEIVELANRLNNLEKDALHKGTSERSDGVDSSTLDEEVSDKE